jgi:hypothetical protein
MTCWFIPEVSLTLSRARGAEPPPLEEVRLHDFEDELWGFVGPGTRHNIWLWVDRPSVVAHAMAHECRHRVDFMRGLPSSEDDAKAYAAEFTVRYGLRFSDASVPAAVAVASDAALLPEIRIDPPASA